MSEDKNVTEIKNNENIECNENIKPKDDKSKFSSKKIIIGCSVIGIVAVAILGYYEYNKYYPSTDNAYVSADVINIGAKVGGYVQTVYVDNNQYVHKGDKLVQIDPVDYNLVLSQAEANILSANGKLSVANEQVDVAKSNIIKAKSNLNIASNMAERYNKLYQEDAGSLQDAQKYSNQQIQAERAYDEAKSSLKQAQIQVDVAKAQIELTKISKDNAKLNLDYTVLTAPSDGYVTNMKIYKGQLISAGQQLFGFVDNQKWWINANFKETDLDRIKVGQPVKITLDMYSHTYNGKVNSISYASGSVFSLLPPENATGNWVKVTQRFPVKITLDDSEKYPLRVGASATVKIDTL